MALPARVFKRRLGGAVKIAKDLGVLKECAFRDHGFELLAGGEAILAAVFFRPARGARGPGDGEVNAGDLLAQLVYQRAFAGARRRGDDEEYSCQFWAVLIQLAISRQPSAIS